MAATVFKAPEKFRLRRADVYDMPGALLDSEEATLLEEGIETGSLLWMEEGKVSVRV